MEGLPEWLSFSPNEQQEGVYTLTIKSEWKETTYDIDSLDSLKKALFENKELFWDAYSSSIYDEKNKFIFALLQDDSYQQVLDTVDDYKTEVSKTMQERYLSPVKNRVLSWGEKLSESQENTHKTFQNFLSALDSPLSQRRAIKLANKLDDITKINSLVKSIGFSKLESLIEGTDVSKLCYLIDNTNISDIKLFLTHMESWKLSYLIAQTDVSKLVWIINIVKSNSWRFTSLIDKTAIEKVSTVINSVDVITVTTLIQDTNIDKLFHFINYNVDNGLFYVLKNTDTNKLSDIINKLDMLSLETLMKEKRYSYMCNLINKVDSAILAKFIMDTNSGRFATLVNYIGPSKLSSLISHTHISEDEISPFSTLINNTDNVISNLVGTLYSKNINTLISRINNWKKIGWFLNNY